jgi:hypothetical protein
MKTIIAMLAIVTLTGCSTFATSRYSPSVDNVLALKKHKGAQVKVGNFSSFEPGLAIITCRGFGPVKSPDGEPYSEYIKKALTDELKMSELYSADAPITLTGQLNALTFSSTSGNWNMSLTVNSSNGQSVTVNENYKYTTSYVGETACNQTAQAFMPAVQDLIAKLVRGNDFKALIK